MSDLIVQFCGLGLLLGGLGFGYWRVTRPYAGHLTLTQHGILLITVLTLAGGFIGAIPWWLDVASSFSWDLPPLAGRMLASAGWAFALACWLALRQPTQRHLRLIMLMLTIYLAPLALAILLFHLDRFDPAAPITYAFFTVVGVMTIGALCWLLRPSAVVAEQGAERQSPRWWVQSWLLMVALLTGVWGVALFITAQGPSPLIWAWPQDLLSSRLIAVMLLTIAGAAIYSLRLAYLARTVLAVLVVYGVGVATAGLWNLLAGKPIPLGYVVAFAGVALGSALLLLVGVGRKGSTPHGIPAQYVLHEPRH